MSCFTVPAVTWRTALGVRGSGGSIRTGTTRTPPGPLTRTRSRLTIPPYTLRETTLDKLPLRGQKKSKYDTWPREIKEETVKLAISLGGRWAATHRRLQERYPEHQVPPEDTIKRWALQYEKEGEFRNLLNLDVQDVWGEVELAALELLLRDIRDKKVPTVVLNSIAGTAADKRMRFMDINKSKQSTTNIYNMIQVRRQELIDQQGNPEIEGPVEGELVGAG